MKVVMIHDMPSYDNTSTYQISRRWENIKKLQPGLDNSLNSII
jgi:hypothetical protein